MKVQFLAISKARKSSIEKAYPAIMNHHNGLYNEQFSVSDIYIPSRNYHRLITMGIAKDHHDL